MDNGVSIHSISSSDNRFSVIPHHPLLRSHYIGNIHIPLRIVYPEYPYPYHIDYLNLYTPYKTNKTYYNHSPIIHCIHVKQKNKITIINTIIIPIVIKSKNHISGFPPQTLSPTNSTINFHHMTHKLVDHLTPTPWAGVNILSCDDHNQLMIQVRFPSTMTTRTIL